MWTIHRVFKFSQAHNNQSLACCVLLHHHIRYKNKSDGRLQHTFLHFILCTICKRRGVSKVPPTRWRKPTCQGLSRCSPYLQRYLEPSLLWCSSRIQCMSSVWSPHAWKSREEDTWDQKITIHQSSKSQIIPFTMGNNRIWNCQHHQRCL